MKRLAQPRFQVITVALAAAAAGLLAAPAAASAAPANPAAAAVVRHDVTAQGVRGASAQAVKYWTSDKLLSAKPADLISASPTARSTAATAAPPARAQASATATAANPLPPSHGLAQVGVASTVGRVFFSDSSGGRYSCSASSVTSEGQDLLYTAAHCVYGGAGLINDGSVPRSWYQNWIYIPAYYESGGRAYAPFGTWSAAGMATISGWISSADLTQDMAAVIVAPLNGQRLVTQLGGNGITWNPAAGDQVYAYGYPVDPAPYNGSTLASCAGTDYRYGGTGPYMDLACGMGHGASGGPWLVNTDPWGVGYLTGVNSWTINGLLFSPYFSTMALDLYNAVRSA